MSYHSSNVLTFMRQWLIASNWMYAANKASIPAKYSVSKSTALRCISQQWVILRHVATQSGKSWWDFFFFFFNSKRTRLHFFRVVRVPSRGQSSFYGLIQQQHLRLGFWASQGHSWWNDWDSTPFITAWHVSCSRFWCRKVTAEDSSFFVEQPSKTTSRIYQKKRGEKREWEGGGGGEGGGADKRIGVAVTWSLPYCNTRMQHSGLESICRASACGRSGSVHGSM